MSHKKAGLCLLVSSSLALLAGDARATHKTWELRDAGMTCVGTSPATAQLDYVDGAAFNLSPLLKTVSCPVTMAGRFGASAGNAGVFSMAEWAAAGFGTVAVADFSSTGSVSCASYARTNTGSTYFSRSQSTSVSGTGVSRLDVFDTAGNTWGGSMGIGDIIVRSFGYRCSLPSNTIIYGYRVNICQYRRPPPDFICDPN